MKTAIVNTLQRQAARRLGELAEDRTPVLIAERGRPAACLLDVESFDLQQERLNIRGGSARGERAVEQDRAPTEGRPRGE
jgi:prevent-host-death family protein